MDGEERLGNSPGMEEDTVPPGVGAHFMGWWEILVVEMVDNMGGIESDETPQSQTGQKDISGEIAGDCEAMQAHARKYRQSGGVGQPNSGTGSLLGSGVDPS